MGAIQEAGGGLSGALGSPGAALPLVRAHSGFRSRSRDTLPRAPSALRSRAAPHSRARLRSPPASPHQKVIGDHSFLQYGDDE